MGVCHPVGCIPFLLGFRKERVQLQLCVVPGARQSAAGTVGEGEEGKSVLQEEL